MSDKKLNVKMSVIQPYIDVNIKFPVEAERSGRKWVSWGAEDDYPSYIYDLYLTVPTLKSCVDGMCDYVCGGGSESVPDNTLRDIVFSHVLFGGACLNVIRNGLGEVTTIKVMDIRHIRTDKYKTKIWFSPDFGRKTWGRVKTMELDNGMSVKLLTNSMYSIYPVPMWAAAVAACEIEKSIDVFHLNAINNGFQGSCLFNFNNGVPEESEQDAITKAIEEKFTGKDNAGRIIVSFNDSKDTATEVIPVSPTDFSDRYTTMAEWSRQQIFTAFRATPNLMGVPLENNGFNSQEYNAAFKIFNKTVIEPLRHDVETELSEILDKPVVIKPFVVDIEES